MLTRDEALEVLRSEAENWRLPPNHGLAASDLLT